MDSAPQQPQPLTKKTKTTNKSLIIGGGVAIVLIIGAILGYFFWYQNPEKQLLDGVANFGKASSTSAAGTLKYTDPDTELAIDFDGATNKKASGSTVSLAVTDKKTGKKTNAKAQAIVTEDATIYIKLDNPEQTVSDYVDNVLAPQFENSGVSLDAAGQAQASDFLKQVFGGIAKKIGNNWIKISTKDLSTGQDASSDVTTCINNFSKKLESDTAARNDLFKAFESNKFVAVKEKLPRDGGSVGYRVNFDSTKKTKFVDATKNNAAIKELNKCTSLQLNSLLSEDVSIDVWLNEFTHEITKLKFDKTEDKGTLSIETKNISYNKPVSVGTPTPVIDFKDVFLDAAALAQ